jgi:hypothetical protein
MGISIRATDARVNLVNRVNKMARPSHKPTPETRRIVETLSGYGVPHEQIGVLVGDGIDHETLVKHYRNDLSRGKAKANAKVGQSLFQKAVSGDTAAMIWWSKSQMRWKGTDIVETPDMQIKNITVKFV